MSESDYPKVVTGEGYAVGGLDDMGEGFGFRKVRKALGVQAFGVNAIVLPPEWVTGRHFHEQQEELYVVLEGRIVMDFGDGSSHDLGPGAMARVDAATVRRVRNPSETQSATYLCAGGKDGYVGRDGVLPEDEDPAAIRRPS